LRTYPEEDGPQGVEGKAHEYGDFVAFALHDFCCDGRKEKVAATEVDDLKTGGLELGDVEHGLKVFIQDIEEAITETPEEEK
jgi:hypothetical protein